jgi:hypothetical protein
VRFCELGLFEKEYCCGGLAKVHFQLEAASCRDARGLT